MGYCSLSSLLKEGNVLFNDALITFYLRLYGVYGYISYTTNQIAREETRCHHMDYSFRLGQWVTMEGRSDDPSHHERTLLPRSYISLLKRQTGLMIFRTHNPRSGSFVCLFFNIFYVFMVYMVYNNICINICKYVYTYTCQL